MYFIHMTRRKTNFWVMRLERKWLEPPGGKHSKHENNQATQTGKFLRIAEEFSSVIKKG